MQRKLPAWFGGGPRGKGPDNGHLAARPTQWAAGHAFHKPGTPEADAWVATHLTTILAGQADRAATEMTLQADRANLSASRREAVDACRRYLNGHLDQLRYDIALAAG